MSNTQADRPKSKAKLVEPYASRIANVRAALEQAELDAYLLCKRTDQFWLTGFRGEDGAVVVTPRSVLLLTDGRFAEAAALEAPWTTAIIRKARGPESIAEVLQKPAHKLERVGFDADSFSFATIGGIRRAAKSIKLKPLANPITPGRQVKTAEEVAAIRRAIEVAEGAFVAMRSWLKPGATEREIAAQLEYEMKRRGASGPAFETIVAIGANGSLPHYAPADQRLGKSDALLIDWGARVDGYVSDLTRVIGIANVRPEIRRIFGIVHEAHDAAIAAARPGMSTGELDRVARRLIEKAGYGAAFSHSLGHGIGLDVHEAPGLRAKSCIELKPGMVVTIEPGIYLPGVGGVRLEDDILITDRGCTVLTSLPIDPLP